MKHQAWIAAIFALLISACASDKILVPTGGSRSDGIVKMSYEYGGFEAPKVDLAQGVDASLQRCKAWGYTGSEPFGGQIKTCQMRSQYGCSQWLVTIEYQCTGGSPSAK